MNYVLLKQDNYTNQYNKTSVFKINDVITGRLWNMYVTKQEKDNQLNNNSCGDDN